MKVALFVNQKFNRFNFHTDSVNKISELLLKELKESDDLDIFVCQSKISQNNNRFIRKVLNIIYWLRHQLYLPEADVVHYVSESEVTIAGIISRLPKVITLHGAEYFSHPTLRAKSRYSFRERFARLLIHLFKHRVDCFTSVSGWAAEIWVNGFNLDPLRMRVVPNPVSSSVFNRPRETKYTDPSLLFVGNTKPQKNLERIVRALDEVIDEYPSISLRIIGPSHDYPQRPYIRCLGAVTEERLYKEMSQVTALLFPSVVESFGMPAVEALALGTPVICSNSSALPEVTMGEATYVDPFDWLDIANAIRKIIGERQICMPNAKMRKYRSVAVIAEYKKIYRRAYASGSYRNL